MVQPDSDEIPGDRVPAKDLSMEDGHVPGDPYCRIDPETGERKFCREDHFKNADKKFVIPTESNVVHIHVKCGCCGRDSYRTDDDSCARCGEPIFNCPNCDEEVHGKPDECPECEADYSWGA